MPPYIVSVEYVRFALYAIQHGIIIVPFLALLWRVKKWCGPTEEHPDGREEIEEEWKI